MVLNKNLWLEINANTNSNEHMPARHRSLWRDWLCSLQFVSVLYSSHKYPQLNNGYGRFFATYNMVSCSLYTNILKEAFAKFVPWKIVGIRPTDMAWCNAYTRLLQRKKNRNYHIFKKCSCDYPNALNEHNIVQDWYNKTSWDWAVPSSEGLGLRLCEIVE